MSGKFSREFKEMINPVGMEKRCAYHSGVGAALAWRGKEHPECAGPVRDTAGKGEITNPVLERWSARHET